MVLDLQPFSTPSVFDYVPRVNRACACAGSSRCNNRIRSRDFHHHHHHHQCATPLWGQWQELVLWVAAGRLRMLRGKASLGAACCRVCTTCVLCPPSLWLMYNLVISPRSVVLCRDKTKHWVFPISQPLQTLLSIPLKHRASHRGKGRGTLPEITL